MIEEQDEFDKIISKHSSSEAVSRALARKAEQWALTDAIMHLEYVRIGIERAGRHATGCEAYVEYKNLVEDVRAMEKRIGALQLASQGVRS